MYKGGDIQASSWPADEEKVLFEAAGDFFGARRRAVNTPDLTIADAISCLIAFFVLWFSWLSIGLLNTG